MGCNGKNVMEVSRVLVPPPVPLELQTKTIYENIQGIYGLADNFGLLNKK